MRVNCEEMRVINKPIEDVIKNEINNCMKYDPYKVCIITSDKDETLYITNLVRNMLKNMNLEEYREEKSSGSFHFYPKYKTSISIYAHDVSHMKTTQACGMRFTTIVFCNPNESMCDDYSLIRWRLHILPHPETKKLEFYGVNYCV